MQQNQPQPEFGQDHIVRRLISKFRKPSDASAIGVPASISASNTLQVPGSGSGHDGVTLSAAELARTGSTDGDSQSAQQIPTQPQSSSIAARLATKQSRWSQLVATAAANAGSKPVVAPVAAGGSHSRASSAGETSDQKLAASESAGSARSSAEKEPKASGDEDMEDYFRAGGKGHQTILENMEKR